jgi:hypothetical protein
MTVCLEAESAAFKSSWASHIAMPNAGHPCQQVYAVTVYLEAERAAHELGVRDRGGFFADNRWLPVHPSTKDPAVGLRV